VSIEPAARQKQHNIIMCDDYGKQPLKNADFHPLNGFLVPKTTILSVFFGLYKGRQKIFEKN
jgi:hypothetical protein